MVTPLSQEQAIPEGIDTSVICTSSFFHPDWPFVRQGSFRESNEAPLLIQSIIVIGLWLSDEENAQSRAVVLHNVLNIAINEQKVRRWMF
jgi:hypothetical protein